MRVPIRRIGNSQGVILPKPLLTQLGVHDAEIEMTIESDAIVLRRPRPAPREGWSEDAARIAATGDEALVWPEFSNSDDGELEW